MKYINIILSIAVITSANAQDSQWFCNTEINGIEKKWINTDIGNQKALIINPQETTNSNLVVFIHGDSPFRDPIYQYNISRNISNITNSTTVALLRPGYRDDCGDVSGGIRGLTMGDNYTGEVVVSIASVIKAIKREKKTGKTIVIGHSGGAALTALLAESNPVLIDHSVLIACPCNLNAWRKSMEELTNNSNWAMPMKGLSPIAGVSKLDLNKKIHLFVGADDVVAPSFLTTEFYNAADSLGADVYMKVVPAEDHESILRPVVLRMILDEVKLSEN